MILKGESCLRKVVNSYLNLDISLKSMEMKEKKHINLRKEHLNKTFEQRRYAKYTETTNSFNSDFPLQNLDLLNQINAPFSLESLLEEILSYHQNEKEIISSEEKTEIKRVTELAIKLRRTLCRLDNVKSLKSNKDILSFYKKLMNNKTLINEKKMMYECLWGMNNISSIKNVDLIRFVKQHSFIITLKQLICANILNYDEQILTETIYCIGNIVLSSIDLRNQTLNIGVLDIIIEIINKQNVTIELQRAATFCISQLCRGDPDPDCNKVTNYKIL